MFNFFKSFSRRNQALLEDQAGNRPVLSANSSTIRASSGKPRLGFLWKVPKPGQRCVLRHATGSQKFHPVIISKEISPLLINQPVTVVALAGREKRWKSVHNAGSGPGFKAMHGALIDAVRDSDLQLLHIFHGDKGVVYLPALRQLNIPISISFHGKDIQLCLGNPGMTAGLQELFSMAAAFMPCSQIMGRTLIEAGCPATKIILNHWSIPMEVFPFRLRSRKPEEPFIFFQACRLIDKKGLPDTIDAFRLVESQMPAVELWIAGEGELREQLESRVAQSRLQHKVKFLGFLQEKKLVEALHASHLFLHPSVTTSSGDQEGIPNALLEAMATGLPSITTRHAGIPEVVTDGETGWLVDEHAPAQLAARMLSCLEDPKLHRRMSQAAHDVVHRQFSSEARGKILDEQYSDLIAAFVPSEAQGRTPTL